MSYSLSNAGIGARALLHQNTADESSGVPRYEWFCSQSSDGSVRLRVLDWSARRRYRPVREVPQRAQLMPKIIVLVRSLRSGVEIRRLQKLAPSVRPFGGQ